MHKTVLAALLGAAALAAFAQTSAAVDAATRAGVVDQVVAAMNERYVFPDVAQRVATALRDPAQRRALDSDDAKVFASRLTDALQALTKDKHLRVMHSDTPVPEPTAAHRPAAEDIARFQAAERQRNFGVERVERLPGNIGYLELRGFANAEWAGEAIASAMTLLAHTEALIVDLRRNGGGDPAPSRS